MCFITRCCIQSCRTKRSGGIAGAFTRKNLIVASANFAIIAEHAVGKTKIYRDSCADPSQCRLSCSQATCLWPVDLSVCVFVEAAVHRAVATGDAFTAFPLPVAGRAFQTAMASSLRSF